MLNDYVLAGIPPELASRSDLIRDGVMLKDPATKLVVGHMKPLLQVPAQLIQQVGSLSSVVNLGVSVATFAYMRSQFNAMNRRLDRFENKIDQIDQKLDALLGTVQRVERKVDGIAHALISMGSKVDSRHRDDVFAEIGAVLDTLIYADKKSPADASAMLANNITPARKAIRRFNSLIDEYEAAFSNGDIGLAETTRMRFISALLSIKIDLVLGEAEIAKEQALAIAKETTNRGRDLLAHILKTNPLTHLCAGMKPLEMAGLCDRMETIDGISAQERMCRAITSPHQTQVELPDLKPNQTNARFYVEAMEDEDEKPSILLRVGINLSVMADGVDWSVELPLSIGPNAQVRKGDVIGRLHTNDFAGLLVTCEMLSPVDGVVIESFLTDPSESNDVNRWTELCRVDPTVNNAHKDPALNAPSAQANLAGLFDCIETLSYVVAASNGVALETGLLLEQGPSLSLPLRGLPFSEECVLIPAELMPALN